MLCVDLFETILRLCGVESEKVLPETLEVDSLSLLPIVRGAKLADRYILSEIFGSNKQEPGRAVVSSKYPEYRLIAYTSSKDQSQITSSELYKVSSKTFLEEGLKVPEAKSEKHYEAYHELVSILEKAN